MYVHVYMYIIEGTAPRVVRILVIVVAEMVSGFIVIQRGSSCRGRRSCYSCIRRRLCKQSVDLCSPILIEANVVCVWIHVESCRRLCKQSVGCGSQIPVLS